MDPTKPDPIDRICEFVAFRFDQEIDRWQVIAALCVAVLILLYSAYSVARTYSSRQTKVIATSTSDSNQNKDKQGQWLYIHICGSVKNPGVYRIGPGTRVNAVVALAGGMNADADSGAVNLARQLIDGERVYVPRVGENPGAIGPGVESPVGPASDTPSQASKGSAKTAAGKVNLNSATAGDLESLPGIGPTLAARIIEYRQKRNGFTDIEQLSNVSGIGPKKLDQIRTHVYVE